MNAQSAVNLVGLVAALPLLGCGTDTLVDVATESSALVTAQCDAASSRAAVEACFATFEACRTGAGAVEADCRAGLDTCLPEGVPHRARGGGRGPGDGGCHGAGDRGGPPPGPPPDGFGARPPLPDGGLGGPGHPGGRGHGPSGRGGGGRGPVVIDEAAVQGCQAAAHACLAAGTDEPTCREQTRTCLHAAFEAAFTARCEALTAACAANAGTNCDELTTRCAEGVREPPAGACVAPDAGTP